MNKRVQCTYCNKTALVWVTGSRADWHPNSNNILTCMDHIEDGRKTIIILSTNPKRVQTVVRPIPIEALA